MKSGFHLNSSSSAQLGTSLFGIAAALCRKVWLERSIAVRMANLTTNRFVLFVNLADIAKEKRSSKVFQCWRQLRMPENLIETAAAYFQTAEVMYLGYEEAAIGRFYKAYLAPRIPRELETATKAPLGIGLKWDPHNPHRDTVTYYKPYFDLSLEEIHARVEAIYHTIKQPEVRKIALDLINFGFNSRQKKCIYLEISEDNNPRRSFDLNFYNRGLRLSDIQPFMARILKLYKIPRSKWHAVYEFSRDDLWGHLSGGIHRDGKDFLNIYYGRHLVFGQEKKRTSHSPF